MLCRRLIGEWRKEGDLRACATPTSQNMRIEKRKCFVFCDGDALRRWRQGQWRIAGRFCLRTGARQNRGQIGVLRDKRGYSIESCIESGDFGCLHEAEMALG